MASSKLMASSHSRNSESSSPSPTPQFTTTNFIPISDAAVTAAPKTVDDVWREIVAGDRRECKEEAPDDEMMTLEDFLAKAGAVDDDNNEEVDCDMKIPMPLTERLGSGVFAFDPLLAATPFQDGVEGSVIGFGNGVEVVEGGRGKRARPVLEQLDKAAQQRQRRMIKNRESAARSRERKQAYQVELESLAVKLEEENDKLLKEKAERKKERYKQLMEKVLPVAQKQKPPCILRRARSLQW
ncbi:G-box-binding factor 4-like [Vigna umbellata]|uniref:G-box-binding factor 4 isoform X1 n=3 Tax=Vigna TaxID=3913 RepID=A0A1S3V7L1_VIGRR|nr:G-box-binding factor 4 isoform X1 [Vigna radiata var. radiata]XP_017415663.1 G-box-binding factor 4 isoform X3 [Vigna angularis]XP_047148390.1 G-box-binding factor 4-like [Vigna umbellata]KAG2401659.1 G-box-binding factor 4 bZIP transcription factor [Vigna angularis]